MKSNPHERSGLLKPFLTVWLGLILPMTVSAGPTNLASVVSSVAHGATNAVAGSLAAPREVLQFYKDWNFAASFSTVEERARVRKVANLDKAADLSKRLKAVGKALHSIEAGIQKIDPGIVAGTILTPPVPAELLELVGVKTAERKVFVTVRVWQLSPAENAHLVSSYEKGLDKTPSTPPQVEPFLPQVPRTELHRWAHINGRWILDEVKIVLLKEEAVSHPLPQR
jgi:hypothetical protein